MERVFIANRGLFASRISRTVRDIGLSPVGGICKSDLNDSRLLKSLDEHIIYANQDGPSAHLNITQVIEAAKQLKASYIHPGIGLLSESHEFASSVQKEGMKWIGPHPSTLQTFGNKFESGSLAHKLGIPILSLGIVGNNKVLNNMQSSNMPLLFKSSRGGGGLGIRVVDDASQVKLAYDRCISESSRAFSGENSLPIILCEKFLRNARHIEVQIVGDGFNVAALGTRECSAQRRFQKMIEVSPAQNISSELENNIVASALKIGKESNYKGLGTMEFLVSQNQFYFIECNARLQVEHTVTENLMKLDLVKLQILLAQGKMLEEILPSPLQVNSINSWRKRASDEIAIQCRINCEKITSLGVFPPDGTITISSYEIPSGNIRIETNLTNNFSPNLQFDSLLALFVVSTSSSSFAQALQNTLSRLNDFKITGNAPTNIELIKSILSQRDMAIGTLHTRWIEEHLSTLVSSVTESNANYDKDSVLSPMKASVVEILVNKGDKVKKGQTLVILSALKMEHEIKSSFDGIISSINIRKGDNLNENDNLISIDELKDAQLSTTTAINNSKSLSESQSRLLNEFEERHNFVSKDSSRGKKSKRPAGRLTAREIVERLCDENTAFVEYGKFAHPKDREDAVADSIICGVGFVNGARAMLCIYDYTVLAGTQGLVGHYKMDRIFKICLKEKLPIILSAEGGGGRAGHFDEASGLDCPSFYLFAKLKNKVPIIGLVSGYCFAGNAALLGVSDVIIASEGNGTTSVGMGGPAMIEGASLGKIHPNDVGPVSMHYKNGSFDILAKNDEEMVDKAKIILSYFTNSRINGLSSQVESAKDILKSIIPENKKRSFDIREVLRCVFDQDSVSEVKKVIGGSIITGFARLNGYSLAFIANDSRVLSGAINSSAAKKTADFLNLVNHHNLPLVSFCDTPGFLVGADAEREGLVKTSGELFIAGANIQSKFVFVVMRRAYGLGAMSMCGGHLKVPSYSMSWYHGEFGAMGFEGAIRLGYREQIKNDPSAFDTLLEAAYNAGKAMKSASRYEIDEVIAPSATREKLIEAFGFHDNNGSLNNNCGNIISCVLNKSKL